MTFIPELIKEQVQQAANPYYMALVDENGRETPITEFDIRRSLQMMDEKENEDHNHQALDLLMERVFAARAIA